MQVFEPFNVYQHDIIDALKKYGIISYKRTDLGDYTREESIALRDILSCITLNSRYYFVYYW